MVRFGESHSWRSPKLSNFRLGKWIDLAVFGLLVTPIQAFQNEVQEIN